MRLRSTLAAFTLLALPMPGGTGIDDLAGNDAGAPRITIASTSPEWTRRIEWGLDRFRLAGLQLPAMAITVHDDEAPCEGNSGLYLPNDPVEVHICSPGPVDSRPARLTTLHELAHAWAESQLSTSERAAFLELRGLDVWYDARVPRHERGMEHAAEVVSWGLMDEMIPIIRIYNAEPAQLSEAFNLLVHEPPLWTTTRTTADRTLADADRSGSPSDAASDAGRGRARRRPSLCWPAGQVRPTADIAVCRRRGLSRA